MSKKNFVFICFLAVGLFVIGVSLLGQGGYLVSQSFQEGGSGEALRFLPEPTDFREVALEDLPPNILEIVLRLESSENLIDDNLIYEAHQAGYSTIAADFYSGEFRFYHDDEEYSPDYLDYFAP